MAAFMVLMIGVGYLMLTLLSLISSKAALFTVNEEQVSISKAEFLSNLRSGLYVILGITGGVLLYRRKTLGWIIGVPLLLIFLLLIGYGVYFTLYVGNIDIMAGLLFLTLILFIFSLLFLLLPSARRKYKVSNRTLLPTLVFLILMLFLYFGL